MSETVLGKDIMFRDNDIQFSNSQDFQTITFKNNLAQSISDRLRTVKGEYYNIEYGSEINKCFGKPRNQLLLSQLNGYIIECLKQEPRIQEIKELNITFNETNKDQIDVDLVVQSIDSQVDLNLIFPLFLS